MQRHPEIWLDQLQSLKSFAAIIEDNFATLISQAEAGVSQQPIHDQIQTMLKGMDEMVDRMERAGATDEDLLEVDDIRSSLETASLELKVRQK